MTPGRRERLIGLATHVYGLFFLAFPREFRNRMGEEARTAFGAGCRNAGERKGVGSLLGYALRGYWDALQEGLAERKATAGGSRPAKKRLPGRLADTLLQDLRFARRSFLRRPEFTAVALLTLSLGIGAATAIFSVVNGVLLEPFPYRDTEELLALWNTNPSRGQPEYALGGSDFFAVDDAAGSFSGLAMLTGATANFTGEDLPPLMVNGSAISAGLFQVLGVGPLMGRAFAPEENQGTHRVVILSHGLWTERFGSDPEIVGKTITMMDDQVEVVGVMPAIPLLVGGQSLRLTDPDELVYWTPLDYTLDWVSKIGSKVMSVVARMENGTTLEQAREELTALSRALEEAGGTPGQRIFPRPLRDEIVGDVSQNLLILMGAVALLLLMACGNLANLFLARATDRERELAVRAALGAGRARMARQVLTEVLLLGSAGGLLGLVLARWGTGALLALAPSGLPRQAGIGVDVRVLLFTIASVIFSSLAAGVLPALRSSGRDPAQGLRSGGRTGTLTRDRSRANRTIIVLQVGLAAILLVGAGLLGRSLTALGQVDTGFSSEGKLVGQIQLPFASYGTPGSILPFFDELRLRLEALPGVSAAVISMDHPMQRSWWNGVTLLDQPPPAPGERPRAIFRPVSDGYFEAYEIPVLQGRTLLPTDRMGEPPVVVVNQAFVDAFFPDGHALGQHIGFNVGQAIWGEDAATEFEVVGVVGNVRFNGLREPTEPAFHIPLSQFPYSFVKVHLATRADPSGLVDVLQATVWSLDPDLALSDIRTMDARVADATAQDRFNALLLSAFALAALVLAAAGIFGVLSYMVAQKRPELGIRLALGAEPGNVLGMVLRYGATTAGMGLAGGLLAALALAPLLASLLFGVTPRDPLVFAAASGVLVLAALISALVPGLRAARTDPMETLRRE